jgi:hypothetical protein
MSLRVVLLGVLLALAVAPAALAAESTIDICRHADGTPASTEGWQHVVTDDGSGNLVANSCAQGGHIDAGLGAGTHGKAGGAASVMFTGSLPPGTTWTQLTAWMAYEATPLTPAQDPAHKIAMMAAGTMPCSWGTGGGGCSQFGSFDAAPLAPVNRITVTRTTPDQPLSVGVMCDSSPGQCPATSGNPYARVRLFRLAVTVQSPEPIVPPVAPPPGSGPLPPGAQPGKLTLRLRRHGARVRLSGRLVDGAGRPVGHARLVLRRQFKGRKAMFSRIRTRADGSFRRVLRRGSRTARVTVRYGALSRTVRIGARR